MKTINGRSNIYSGLSASGTIPRSSLIQKMKNISAKKNIYICAPGGYGKTVAASQWLNAVRGKTTKMTVGEADNDPGVFYNRLALMLLRLTRKEKTMPSSGISFDKLLEIIKQLPDNRSRCYFVLDDLHIIRNQEIIDNMPIIASRLPGYLGSCLVSRSEPTGPLMETGLFETLTMDDLLFSLEEVENLSAEKDRELSTLQIENILKTTGGWAMYLIALLADVRPSDINSPPNITLGQKRRNKTPQNLTQYLDTRVWGLWDRQIKTLLLSLAVPVELKPKLAERLTGQKDGRGLLERLVKKENAFLSLIDKDTYRFHDIFREFLLERIAGFLGKEEVRRLHDIAAQWYYEQGDYLAGGRHYIYNRNHEGVNRCMSASNRYHEKSGSLSVETSVNFATQYVINLPLTFIQENPYLISHCLFVAFLNGNSEDFKSYLDMEYKMIDEIAAKYPEHMETVGFECALDFRVSLNEYAKQMESMMPLLPKPEAEAEARTNTMTQNLPFFHRSMRDYSEYYELKADDLARIRNTFGMMIGRDYDVMEHLIIAGIYYERGELLNALRHSLEGYHLCDEGMQSETIFSSYMMLSASLYATGAFQEANGIMDQTENFIEHKAQFLRANFKALQTERAIRSGNTEAAREWLIIYKNRSSCLPFYQIYRHFSTLRAYIAVENYRAAIAFGNRLQILATEYKRPLDRIESALLTAIALWKTCEKNTAIKQLEHALNIAAPYGFTQLLLNEGKEILPMLWELQKAPDKPVELMGFIVKLMDSIYLKFNIKPAEEEKPKLTTQQRNMLSYLDKGMSYNEIADATGIAHATVKYHILLMYKRLGVHNTQQAVMKAKALGFINDESIP